MASSLAADRAEHRSGPPSSPAPLPRIHAFAVAALGEVRASHVLVSGAGAELARAQAALVARGAHVVVLDAAHGAARARELPTWSVDAIWAEGLLARARDLEAALYDLRRWVRPDAPFALVEPLSSGPGAGRGLSERDLDTIRRHLPRLRVTRFATDPTPPDRASPWSGALRAVVESAAPWLPALARGRVVLLAGRLPP